MLIVTVRSVEDIDAPPEPSNDDFIILTDESLMFISPGPVRNPAAKGNVLHPIAAKSNICRAGLSRRSSWHA